MKFNTLDICEPILKAIQQQGYETPTPIQAQAIPHALIGKDILGCAQTGTGKTAAFLIPTIQRLKTHNPNKIRSLVLTPTRELAIQIQENLSDYAKHTSIKSAVIFGGVSQKPQENAIKRGVDIVIATPGRLLDLIKQKVIHINEVEIFILDEADRMLDMGFLFDVKRIVKMLPEKKQTLFFSATMPKEIKALTNTLLHDPIVIEVTPPSSTVDIIKQTLYYVDKANKKHLLIDLLKTKKLESTLIFTRTKNNANRLAKFLEASHIQTGVLHGNKSQAARQIALLKFKNGEIRVLVATDIAARGIDVNELSYVFNYDIPNEAEAYVHRIGRTGRAGKDGTSISFADIDEIDLVRNIQKLIHQEIPVCREHDYPMMITTPSLKKTQRGGGSRGKTGTPKPKKVGAEKEGLKEKKKKPYGATQKSEAKPYGKPSNPEKKKKSNHDSRDFGSKKKSNNNTKPSSKSYANKTKAAPARKSKQGVRGK